MDRVRNEFFIKIVAEQLAEKYLIAMGNIGGEKNYYSHVGCLSEILEWAEDFSELYYNKYFHAQFSGGNDFHDDFFLEALIIFFGRQRLLAFYKQNSSSHTYFIEKHSALIM
jgi:hypothetical protein